MDLSLAAGAREVNDLQAGRAVARLERASAAWPGGGSDLGLGFRPDVKGHICSPTFLVEASLRSYRADARVHDPLYTDAELAAHGFGAWHPAN